MERRKRHCILRIGHSGEHIFALVTRTHSFECGRRKARKAKMQNPDCSHDRLDEDGICRACGQDCRGIRDEYDQAELNEERGLSDWDSNDLRAGEPSRA